MRREGGQDERERRTNNDKKSPTNIFFLFSNSWVDPVLGAEFELPMRTEGAEARELELGLGEDGKGGGQLCPSVFL
jgi:hypothetical protein